MLEQVSSGNCAIGTFYNDIQILLYVSSYSRNIRVVLFIIIIIF